MKTRHLTFREVHSIHQRIADRLPPKLINSKPLKVELSALRDGRSAGDPFVTIQEEAARLCRCIIGNAVSGKDSARLALATMATFLDMNGFVLDAGEDETVCFIEQVQAGLSTEECTAWVQSRMRAAGLQE